MNDWDDTGPGAVDEVRKEVAFWRNQAFALRQQAETGAAIATAHAAGFTIFALAERSDGTWTARLWHRTRARESTGKRGFDDAFTDYGRGSTAADAILRAMCLRVCRDTGKTIEAPPWSDMAEKALAAALDAATRVRR